MPNYLFGAVAPFYYARNIPVIPLWPHDTMGVKSAGKRPIPTMWNHYAAQPVLPATQQDWLSRYPNANIGLVAGPQSNVIFVDLDSTDPKVEEALTRSLGVMSPWKRTGRKGYVLAYRYHPSQKNFKVYDVNNKTLVECLANRQQAVIPPSIHPDTKLPYSANCELLDVIDNLPLLPENFEEKLRYELQRADIELSHSGMSNLSNHVPLGARDNSITYAAGLFAHYVTRGERNLNEALGQMKEWYDANITKVEGDNIDVEKGYQKILEFLKRDVIERRKPLPIGWDKDLDLPTKDHLATIFTDEHQEWSAQDLKSYAYQQFALHPDPEDPKRIEAVHYIIERLSRSPSLNNLDQETIIAYISQTSRIPGMTVTNIRKRIKELRLGEISGHSHMEIATAVISWMEEFGALRQVNGRFHQWKGAQWDPLDEADILKVIAEQFDGFDITKKQNDHVGILKILRTIVKKGLTDSNDIIYGVNFANGFLHYDPESLTVTLKPHMPYFGATYTLPYRYMPELASQCQQFHKLLHDAWGDDPDYEDKVKALQQVIAVIYFQYGVELQRACLLQGVGNSGKSTIIHIVKGLLPPDSISVIPPDEWEDKFAPTMMAGKLLNVCYELTEKKMLDGKSFKEIVDGSEQSGQLKNGQLFKFIPRAFQIVGSNHLPKTTDTSEGFNRRWLILNFRKPISLAQKILGLHNQIISAEREAIAAWAVEAFLPLIFQKDYTLPASHEELMNDMANDNNSVRFFLNESRRILTPKKVMMQLAAAARKTTEAQQQSPNVKAVLNASLPAKSWQNVEAFKEYATQNPTSEGACYGEYTAFCTRQAGVRAVGLKAFRMRLRELETIHHFKTLSIPAIDGHEDYIYRGIVLSAASSVKC